jgi:adenine-specific DNA-methyltransferase
MTPKILQPKEVLNKAYRRVKPIRSNIENFKANLIRLLQGINERETEEFHNNLVIEFLKNTWYQPHFFINTKAETV